MFFCLLQYTAAVVLVAVVGIAFLFYMLRRQLDQFADMES